MAYVGDGVRGRFDGRSNRLAIVAWIFARHPKIRVSFSHNIDLGPSRGAIRRVAFYLRYPGFFPDCVTHRGAVEHRDSSVSNRACASLDSAAARLADRNARDDSECDPWVVGDFRHDSVVARLSVSAAQAAVRLDPIFHRANLRAQHARWRNHYCDNDSANHHFGLTRDLAQRSQPAARGGLCAWCDALGSHTDRSAQLRQEG